MSRQNAYSCVLLVLLAGIPACETFTAGLLSPCALWRTGASGAASIFGSGGGRMRPSMVSSGRTGVLAAHASGEGQAADKMDGFDSLTGYGDMTGVAKFDDAWEEAYRRKDRIRCPFWRRRTVDALEVVLRMARFVLARHKSLDVTPVKTTGAKSVGMTVAEVADVIREDFEKRQYYVTGRLSKRIYSDDCFFDAPDPDMPVKGLRKYVDAISHLFEHKTSKVELISMQELPNRRAIIARWRLEGTLMLPWRPSVRAYTGVTLYQLNARGLVCKHTELWSTHVAVAFLSAVLPIEGTVSKALGLIGIPVHPPAAPLEELLKLPPMDQCPDPAPLLSKP